MNLKKKTTTCTSNVCGRSLTRVLPRYGLIGARTVLPSKTVRVLTYRCLPLSKSPSPNNPNPTTKTPNPTTILSLKKNSSSKLSSRSKVRVSGWTGWRRFHLTAVTVKHTKTTMIMKKLTSSCETTSICLKGNLLTNRKKNRGIGPFSATMIIPHWKVRKPWCRRLCSREMRRRNNYGWKICREILMRWRGELRTGSSRVRGYLGIRQSFSATATSIINWLTISKRRMRPTKNTSSKTRWKPIPAKPKSW